MESNNGILCWTGRIVEVDIELRVNQTGLIVQKGVAKEFLGILIDGSLLTAHHCSPCSRR